MSYNTDPLYASLLAEYAVPETVTDAFNAHFQLLLRWNRVHNLTRVTHPEEATRKHYLDAWLGVLQVEKLLPSHPWQQGVWDIGSGAGFPGIACALRWQVPTVWVEPSSKRVSFLQRIKQELGLKHVEVRNARLENMPDEGLPQGLMVSRATFPWQQWQKHLIAQPQTHLALWCGKDPSLKEWQMHLQSSDAQNTKPSIGKQADVALPHAEFRQILTASPQA